MQALIDFLVRNLMQLWPVVWVNEWQTGMMVRCGIIHRVLGPGLHWRWWFIERVVTYSGTEVVLQLPTASVTTADGYALAVDANFGFTLVDIARCWRTLWNMQMSLTAAAQGIVCSEIARLHWSDLQGAKRADREQEILDALNEFAEPRGMRIDRFHLVACVEARQHRHFVDGSLTR